MTLDQQIDEEEAKELSRVLDLVRQQLLDPSGDYFPECVQDTLLAMGIADDVLAIFDQELDDNDLADQDAIPALQKALVCTGSTRFVGLTIFSLYSPGNTQVSCFQFLTAMTVDHQQMQGLHRVHIF
jgi:hypothetical protein